MAINYFVGLYLSYRFLWPELLRTLGFGNFDTELRRDGSVTNTRHGTEYVSCCISHLPTEIILKNGLQLC